MFNEIVLILCPIIPRQAQIKCKSVIEKPPDGANLLKIYITDVRNCRNPRSAV
jgi:hypothetical protein